MKNNLSGQRFGRLIAIEPSGRKKWGCIAWNCLCDCGKTTELASNTLRSGYTKSCGCLLADTAAETQRKHSYCGTPTYKSWDSMMQRCNNPNSSGFKKYGAIGISVCDRWKDFSNFLADMGTRPDGHTIDRIDNYKGYEPSNCRWATHVEQSHNKRRKCTSFDDAEEVRRYRKTTGSGPKEIADALGLSLGSVEGILYLNNISRPR